jgi:hypothetical protein
MIYVVTFGAGYPYLSPVIAFCEGFFSLYPMSPPLSPEWSRSSR